MTRDTRFAAGFLIICANSSPLPLISGLEFGHEQHLVTLPLGARARLVNQAAATTPDDRRPSGADRINSPERIGGSLRIVKIVSLLAIFHASQGVREHWTPLRSLVCLFWVLF